MKKKYCVRRCVKMSILYCRCIFVCICYFACYLIRKKTTTTKKMAEGYEKTVISKYTSCQSWMSFDKKHQLFWMKRNTFAFKQIKMLNCADLVFHYQHLTEAAHLNVTFLLLPSLWLFSHHGFPCVCRRATTSKTETPRTLHQLGAQPGFIPKYAGDIYAEAVEGETMPFCHFVCECACVIWN